MHEGNLVKIKKNQYKYDDEYEENAFCALTIITSEG